MNGFKCLNCKKIIELSKYMGTKHRNHCNFCLYSVHVDAEKSGDRNSICNSKMKPIGLTFKKEGKDRYGRERVGEIMIIHFCLDNSCKKISINRIAGDDSPEAILNVYRDSFNLDVFLKDLIKSNKIDLIDESYRGEVEMQLFGSCLN